LVSLTPMRGQRDPGVNKKNWGSSRSQSRANSRSAENRTITTHHSSPSMKTRLANAAARTVSSSSSSSSSRGHALRRRLGRIQTVFPPGNTDSDIAATTLRTRASPLLTDVGATAVTLTAASVAVGSIKYLERSGTVNKLLSRKLIHSVAGPGFLAFWPLFGDTHLSQLICAITPLVNGATLFLAGAGLRADSNSISAISRCVASLFLLLLCSSYALEHHRTHTSPLLASSQKRRPVRAPPRTALLLHRPHPRHPPPMETQPDLHRNNQRHVRR